MPNCIQNQNKVYKLVMTGEKNKEDSNEVEYLEELKQEILKVLHGIKEGQDSDNLRTDMWCHFGHVFICNVDEADVGEIYDSVKDVNENFNTGKSCSWSTWFEAGVEKMEYEQLETALKVYRVYPNTRFDYSFVSPTGRRIRFKAFARKISGESEDAGDVTFQECPKHVPMKNLLAELPSKSSHLPYYLCAPSTHRLKVDIIIPYLHFDCHLIVRTTMKETKSVQDEEEDRILIDFLNENLELKDGKLKILKELPAGFSKTYWRTSQRRMYSHSITEDQDPTKKVDFNVTISEEESSQSDDLGEGNDRKTDIHLHCDEWDALLDKEDWEPEQIVSKLPAFLTFIKDVQLNIHETGDEA